MGLTAGSRGEMDVVHRNLPTADVTLGFSAIQQG
jgi:hypothetical protein